jgi:hypothetical protein
MFFFLCVLSLCLYVFVSLFLSVSLVFVSVCLSVSMCICLYACLSRCLSTSVLRWVFVLSLYPLPFCTSRCFSVRSSFSLSRFLSFYLLNCRFPVLLSISKLLITVLSVCYLWNYFLYLSIYRSVSYFVCYKLCIFFLFL